MFKFKKFNSKIRKNGFTILEVVVAIFILTVGMVGIFFLISQTIASSSIAASRLTAAYLAQEGIEITRNIRDGNWLEQITNPAVLWDDGLGFGDWEADYTEQILTSGYGRYLKIDGSGFYNYSAGADTKFKRKISVAPSSDILSVTVTVEWQEKGRNYQLSASEDLYNWAQ